MSFARFGPRGRTKSVRGSAAAFVSLGAAASVPIFGGVLEQAGGGGGGGGEQASREEERKGREELSQATVNTATRRLRDF